MHDLNDIKATIESAKSIKEYENALVQLFSINIMMNYGEGWMDILSSDEELVNKIIKPYTISTKIGLFKKKKARLIEL